MASLDFTILQWIEDLPESPIPSETVSESSTMESRSEGKRKADEMDPSTPSEASSPPDQSSSHHANLPTIPGSPNEPKSTKGKRRQSAPSTPLKNVQFAGSSAPSSPLSGGKTPVDKSDKKAGIKLAPRELLRRGFPPVKLLQWDKSVSYQPAIDLADYLKRGSATQMPDLEPGEAAGHPDPRLQKLRETVQYCRSEGADENGWIGLVAQPLFQLAIGERSFIFRSVESAPLSKLYLPQVLTGIYDRRIDYVLTYPNTCDQWKPQYEATELSSTYCDNRNHFDNPAVAREFVGFGLEMKTPDGPREEAEVQAMTFAAGFFQWMQTRGHPGIPLPPLVVCTMLGFLLEFHIAYAVETNGWIEVTIWGPHIDLRCDLETMEGLTRAVRTLRAVLDYLEETFLKDLVRKVF